MLNFKILFLSMQFGGFSAGELSEEEVSELPSCAFAGRSTSSSAIQHHYLTSLHHSAGNLNKLFLNRDDDIIYLEINSRFI